MQDDERRRIARELHDSVGQTLAALTMNLTAVRTDIERLRKTAGALAEVRGADRLHPRQDVRIGAAWRHDGAR